MKWMSLSGMPAARNWSASSLATRCVSPRLCTLGISIACLNNSRVFACHAGSSLVGSVRGSGTAQDADEAAESKNPSKYRMFKSPGPQGRLGLGRFRWNAHAGRGLRRVGNEPDAPLVKVERYQVFLQKWHPQVPIKRNI